ncbi:MAG: DNA polymerase III subunit chi [Rhodospirillales bacterium]|nr:DNA polymerase III subunit chi [Rhodospirillales bacterium]
MTEIRFYHLQTLTLEQALPRLLLKAYEGGKRILVKLPDAQAVESLNTHLWTFHPNYFLPHGSKKDGYAERQPIWLTDTDENPNAAETLILANGADSPLIDKVSLCCDIFSGFDAAQVSAARARWKTYQSNGHALTYWQQTEQGGWVQKG